MSVEYYIYYDSKKDKIVDCDYINKVSEDYWCDYVVYIGVI